jgi:hypothetical protein
VTLFGIFFTPVFFLVVDHMSHWRVFTEGIIGRIAVTVMDVIRLRFVTRPLKRVLQRKAAK